MTLPTSPGPPPLPNLHTPNDHGIAKVVYPLTAQLKDELTLKAGQIVKITHIIDKDWFR